ncbi:MAPEG family protein [Sphingomonas sp.]|uniref:MAPEG family protein n=1 Tax=Sphingomonas sp. TaxID=28214 RepID=UPI0028A88513|nr:MAPEG family protein [Sphingomonas sp.]
MADERAFKAEQRGVAIGMASALLLTIVVLGLVAFATHGRSVSPFPQRFQDALRLDLLVILWVAAGIANVARLRFFSEQDIAGSGGQQASERVRIANAILENSFEQAVLAIVTHLIVAATFAGSTPLVAALACLFAIGRLLFWTGYKRGASGRAFGFALTFYPSVVALLACALAALVELLR